MLAVFHLKDENYVWQRQIFKDGTKFIKANPDVFNDLMSSVLVNRSRVLKLTFHRCKVSVEINCSLAFIKMRALARPQVHCLDHSRLQDSPHLFRTKQRTRYG